MMRLANLNIEIESLYDRLAKYCEAYCVTEGEPDISIKMEMKDIEKERNGGPEYLYPNKYVETVAALRKIAEVLPKHNRVLCHGAAITYEEKNGYLFMAPSGTGKTTIIRQWRTYLGNAVRIVNGDKPFLDIREDSIYVCGTPWGGKEKWHRNRQAELKGICYLKRGETSSVRRMDPMECFELIVKQIYVPKNGDMIDKSLELIEKILKKVPVYELTCDISEEAVKCSFEALTGLQYNEHAKKQEV